MSEASKLVLVMVLRGKGDADCGGTCGGGIDGEEEEQRARDRTRDNAKDGALCSLISDLHFWWLCSGFRGGKRRGWGHKRHRTMVDSPSTISQQRLNYNLRWTSTSLKNIYKFALTSVSIFVFFLLM